MGYLSTKIVQEKVSKAVGREFVRSLGRQVITSDLVAERGRGNRAGQFPAPGVDRASGNGRRATAIDRRGQATRGYPATSDGGGKGSAEAGDMAMIRHARYISAKLRRSEIEVLRSEFKSLLIQRVWQNASKRALICRSSHWCRHCPRSRLTVRVAGTSNGRCWTPESTISVRILRSTGISPVSGHCTGGRQGRPRGLRTYRPGWRRSRPGPRARPSIRRTSNGRWTGLVTAPTWPGSSPVST